MGAAAQVINGIIAVGRCCPAELLEAAASNGKLEGVTEIVKPLLYTHAACVNVHRVKSTQQLIVVKTYIKSRLTEAESHQVEHEVLLHQEAHHEHVVAFWLAFDRGANRHVVMEYCGEGDLRRCLTGRSEQRLRTEVVVPLLHALEHIHSQGIVHRDVKPDNVFMQHGSAKLGDFGLAVSMEQVHASSRGGDASDCSSNTSCSTGDTTNTALPCLAHASSSPCIITRSCSEHAGALQRHGSVCSAATKIPASGLARFASTNTIPASYSGPPVQPGGTAAYTAPEVLEAVVHGRSVAPAIGAKNDIWALGLLALEAMTGRHPFAGPNSTSSSAALAVLATPKVPIQHSCISPLMQDWLALALARNPDKRATAAQLLRHPWVTGASSGRSSPATAVSCRSADHKADAVLKAPAAQLAAWGFGGIGSWED